MSPSVRHEWYQTDAKVVIAVLIKNAADKNYKVYLESERLQISTDDGYSLDLKFYRPINVERSSHKVTAAKIEISLMKQTGEHWHSLEQKAPPPVDAAPPPIHKKNWDKVTKEFEKKDEEEAQNEDALNRLFKKIYNTSSPEVQKAMNKSFSESGGTVLSTNWNEVSKDKVEMKPPEGAEFRKWNS